MKHLLLALLVCTSLPAMAADAGHSTAKAVSVLTFSGVKEAMARNDQLSPQQKRCFGAIPNEALADAYLPLVVEQLDATMVAQSDSFFASALGKRYLKAFFSSPSTAGFGADAFTQREESIIRKTMNDPTFTAFAMETSVENPGAPQDKLRGLLQACL
ncbi:hypothetical protein [Stenotrophomonas sp. PS02300]|uniref:hypothetical protein n=1 Tax=Stenotrophomonas sp. PS02300 TaxID=2991426 RepID=UPI00249BD464|nr:hypothetical protein [Stenotrophomonas sp. PS02300]